MSCKKAIEEAAGDLKKAKEILAEWGAEIVNRKTGCETVAGMIEAYIHAGGRIGVLVELKCETDFVARNEDFKKLAHELALQISSMDPEEIKTLLDQDYVRDPSKKISQLIGEAITKFGENIKIGRFIRYEIGEES